MTHFGHNKDFLWSPRGYNSSEEHDADIIKKWNNKVEKTDDVFILGDLMLGDNEQGMKKIEQLNGHLHIILGNHDSQTRIELYKQLPNVVEVKYAKVIKVSKQHYYLSHYPTICSNYNDKPYHNHMINLYGHTHQQTNFFEMCGAENPFMYHVGVDSHDCYPVSIEKIDKDIHKKIQELYTEKIKREKELENYYKYGLGYFDKRTAAEEEILD